MTTRPIIFSAPMVRAILEGHKTQTRRILKRPTDHFHASYTHAEEFVGKLLWWDGADRRNGRTTRMPYAVGDRLWLREAHAMDGPMVRYYATDDVHELRRKRPSIHMPRWASRITLTVTAVTVERLQEISGADAKAEGVSIPAHLPEDGADLDHARRSFITLWNSIHGPRSWDANPWVAAITFTAERRNIDA